MVCLQSHTATATAQPVKFVSPMKFLTYILSQNYTAFTVQLRHI